MSNLPFAINGPFTFSSYFPFYMGALTREKAIYQKEQVRAKERGG